MLKDYRKKLEPEGLVECYSDVSELRDKLTRHITSVLDKIVPEGSEEVKTSLDSESRVFIDQLEDLSMQLSSDWNKESQKSLEVAMDIIRGVSYQFDNLCEFIPGSLREKFSDRLSSISERINKLLYIEKDVNYRIEKKELSESEYRSAQNEVFA